MSWEKYDDKCKGCEPAIIDARTGVVMPRSSRAMIEILRWWRCVSIMEKQAWHRVTCLNSRVPLDLAMCKGLVEKMGDIVAATEVKH